jgi:biopolymer transport protein ExbD
MVVADTTADSEIKKLKKEDQHGPIVLIKADEKAKYKDMVDIIDEMAICNIASYAVVDITPVEVGMLKNAPK